jgi:drug/metabolite transporter (DMT)-like permease
MKWWIILLAVFISIGWGAMSQMEAAAVKNGTPMGSLSINTATRFVMIGLVALVLFLIPNTNREAQCTSSKCWALSLGVGVLGSACAVAYIFLLKRTNASVLLSFVYPVSLLCTVIIGKIFMKEELSVTQTAGIGFAMLAAVLLAINGYKNGNKQLEPTGTMPNLTDLAPARNAV